MSRPKQTQDQIKTMQDRIINATMSLITRVEPEEISIRAIAEEVGISHMAIYSYFKNRDELIENLVQKQIEIFEKQLDQIICQNSDQTVELRLRQVFQFYLEYSIRHPKGYRILWLTQHSNLDRAVVDKSVIDRNVSKLACLIQAGIEQGEFAIRDISLAAMTVLAIINAPLLMFHLGHQMDKKKQKAMLSESMNAALLYLKCGEKNNDKE